MLNNHTAETVINSSVNILLVKNVLPTCGVFYKVRLSYFSFQPVLHDDGVTKAVVCAILSVGWCI